MANNNNQSSGIGFTGLLGIVFIILKLCGVISWSWIWVLCPLWIGFAIVLVAGLVYVFADVIGKILARRGR